MHGTRPTPAGELLYTYAKSILRQADEACAALKQDDATAVGRVSVGLPTSTLHMVGQELVSRVTNHHGNRIALEIVEGATAALAERLGRQTLDIAVIPDCRSGSNFEARPLLVEQLLAYGHADREAATSITLAELTQRPLALPAFPNSVRVKLENACLERNLDYAVCVESASAGLLMQIAQARLGWAILPWAAAQGFEVRLDPLTISDTSLSRVLSLCVSKAAADNLARDLIRSYLVEIILEKVRDGAWPYTHLWQDEDAPDANA